MGAEKHKTILFVEDEILLALSQKMLLEEYGYGVLMAHTASEALRLFNEQQDIDLVLMDMDLGKGPDGAEVAEQLLRIKEIPIVFLSSHTEKEVLEKIEQVTTYGYVLKGSSQHVLDASLKMAFKLFDANTAIKNSALKQKTMISKISDVISIMGADGTVGYVSPNCEKYFGWQPEELEGKKGSITICPDDLKRVQAVFNDLLEVEQKTLSVEYRYKCKDGSYKPIELSATNFLHDPVICGVLLNYRDISERRRTEAILREKEIATQVALRANRAKDEFIASISHELRTPLTAIMGLAETILRFKERGRLNDKKMEFLLQNILAAGEQLDELVEDILDYAEIEAGKTELKPTAVDISAILKEILFVLRPKAEEKGLSIQNEVNAPELVWADLKRIKQIIWNLLDNAIKFTSEGGVILRLIAGVENVELQVIDTGRGIAPQEREVIFQRFVRLDKSGQNSGTGLGLPISRKLAQLMGGEVSVSGMPETGSVFSLRLKKAQ